MFTGIIQAVGAIQGMQAQGSDVRIQIDAGKLPMDDVALGDSIAVNGVCLTVIEKSSAGFSADISNETLSRTTLGILCKSGSARARVNLEKALMPTTRLGGHLVSGHVDGVGTVQKRWTDGRSERFLLQTPGVLAKYIAEKGSVCIDGISLTVNAVNGAVFELNIVPHTLQETTMGDYRQGQAVNIEVDIIARYLERLLLGDKAAQPKSSSGAITDTLLAEHGFIK